jgi:hypothetical protein
MKGDELTSGLGMTEEGKKEEQKLQVAKEDIYFAEAGGLEDKPATETALRV